MLLLFKDKIVKCSLVDDFSILERRVNVKESRSLLKGFVDHRVFMDVSDSSMTYQTLSDISKTFIITSNDQVLILDEKLDIVGDIDPNHLYVDCMKIKDYKIVTNDHKMFVLDTDNNKVTEINIAFKPVLIGNKLYAVQEKSLFEINVADLIGQP